MANPRSAGGPGETSLDMAPVPAIVVEGLSKTFVSGRRRRRTSIEAVRDISYLVEPGERLAYIGPNGAGKSTSIKMLTGILHPTSGTARVLGLVPWTDRSELAGRIGTLFGQRSQLWAELPSRSSFEMLAAIFGLDPDTRARRVADLGDLLEARDLFDQPVRTLSLGQRMRCELAACMLHDPEILFLDEPTIGLDLLGKQLFRDLLIRVNEERGTTVFLTSHDVADIESVAQRAVIVNHGRIIHDDTVDALRGSILATKRVEVGLDHPVPDDALARSVLDGVEIVDHTPSTVVLRVDTTRVPIRAAIDALLDRLPVADLSITDPPLERIIAGIYATPSEPSSSLEPPP